MTDFLSALVARSIEKTPDVRPSLAPLFASDARGASPATIEERHELVETPAVAPRASRHAWSTAAVSDLPMRLAAAPPADSKPEARPVVVASPERQPASAARAGRRADIDGAVATAPKQNTAPPPASPVIERRVEREPVASLPSASRTAQRPMRDESQQPALPATPAARSLATEIAKPDQQRGGRVSPTRRIEVAPTLSVAHHEPPEQRRLPKDEAPAPEVHITIGRVDVRAIVTPEAAPRVAEPLRHAPLPLDAYLRQRDGRTA